MHIHILGICGTFMAGVAVLAKAAGHKVTGSDSGVYPPMSTVLSNLGVEVSEGYSAAHLDPAPDCVVVGNVMSRGNPAVEHMLDSGLEFDSGPGWLARHVLRGQWVLAVSGTHGKTTTSSMLAWILEYAGLDPGFLIGGLPLNFGVSARAGQGGFFVVEADEYDTAFFDKRSKFVHYRPRTLVVGNLEFDHADIFPDLAAIQAQFHQLLRTVPNNGLVIHPNNDPAVDALLDMGCWTPTETFGVGGASWRAEGIRHGGREFELRHGDKIAGRLSWELGGLHNVSNALAAVAASRHAGVPVSTALDALAAFKGVARRMQLFAETHGIRVYDDFAHHPTAIATTLAGMREDDEPGRIVVVLEPRSNTMKMGVHSATLARSLEMADRVHVYAPHGLRWKPRESLAALGARLAVADTTTAIVSEVVAEARPGDRIVIMSNGGFEGLHGRLASALARHRAATGSGEALG